MMNQGKLPNFSKLTSNSTYGPLESVYPPGSYIAWPSYMTGVNPGKHSLFYPIVFKEKFEYAGRPFDTSMINYPTIYEMLSEAGFSVGVVNHPATFPPIKVDDFFINLWKFICLILLISLIFLMFLNKFKRMKRIREN